MRPARSAAPARSSADRLGLYRILASFPLLDGYRAKLFAVVAAAFAVPLFLTWLALVLGAGRMSVLALFLLFTSLALLGCGCALWGIDRLLAPLDSTIAVLDAHVEGEAPARVELPGTDAAARVLRDVQALVGRIRANEADKLNVVERDALTGLWNRMAGRKQAKAFVDEAFKTGRAVRVAVADVDYFAELNASHGPIACDLVLKTFGGRLAKAAASDGVALRWDGDRFVLVQAAAEGDFRPIDDLVARTIIVMDRDEPVTLSVGVAEANDKVPFEVLLGRAEAALRATRAARGG